MPLFYHSYFHWLLAIIILLPPSYPAAPYLNHIDRRRACFISSSDRRRTRFISSDKTSQRGQRSKAKHNTCAFSNVPPPKKAVDRVLFSGIRGGGDDNGENNDESYIARGISFSLFLTYLTVMGAKCALPSTLSMLSAPNSGLSHSNTILSRQDIISRLLALSTLSIAGGKLLLGPIIDKLGGVFSLQIALSTLCICLGSIGFGTQTCPTLTSLAMYWIVVDFAFSSCWAACVKTIRDYLPEERWSREIGRLAMAARSGNAISFACFAWLLQWAQAATTQSKGAVQIDASWRWVFRASGVIQLIPLLMLSYFGRKDLDGRGSIQQYKSKSKPKSTLKDSLAILYQQSCTLEFWLHLISRSIIMVLVSFLLFIPSYMGQCFGMSSASSARVGSMFALGCLLSVSTLAERTYPSIATTKSHRSKAYFMLAFLAMATICLALQATFLQNLLTLSPMAGSLIMFLFGFSLAIPFYLPSSMFALKRGGEDGSATIADAFDVCGFGLLAIFNGIVARVLDVSGDVAGSASAMLLSRKKAWRPVFLWMLGGSIAAMASLFGAVWLEGERDKEKG